MKNVVLQDLLHELNNRGDKELGSELAAFIDATGKAKSIPYSSSRKMLAQAAKMLRDNEIALAHDYLGAATEAYLKEKAGEIIEIPNAVTASLTQELAPLHVFKEIENFTTPTESPDFNESSQELVSVFANLLLKSGYIDEARKYLTAFNSKEKKEEGNETMSTKQALKDLQKKYKKGGDFVRAKALEEVIADLDEQEEEELPEEESEGKKVEEPCAEEPCEGEEDPFNKPIPESKPVLEVEAPSDEEEAAKEEAQACIARGNIKKAKKSLAKAANLERLRLTAALIKAGDMELALAGLVEAEGEDPVQDEKSAGMNPPKEEEKEEAPVEDESPVHDDEAPTEDEMEKRQDEAVEKEEPTETEVASGIAKATRKALRRKDMKTVVAGLKDLESLEKAIVAGVETAEKKLKNSALAKEGYETWKEVRAINLNTIKIVAESEGDKEEVEKAALGLEALEDDDVLDDTLDSEPESDDVDALEQKEWKEGHSGEDFDADYDDEGEKEEKDEEDEGAKEDEADGMKYETLQSIDELKGMDIDRESLAFTFWESKEDPFWTIQANGKPIGEVHLQDQTDPEDVRAFFCDQSKWPNVIAQSTEKAGLYPVLTGVKTRFYANAITKGVLASTLRTEVEASLKTVRTEKLATLRKDFIEAVTLSAEALNKGLMTGKTNPLKKAFVDKLASLGFSHPGLVVEECFASAFRPYLEQIVADAEEYLAMPKEALAHTKRMITSATNVAVAQASNFVNETMSERLSRTSMPLQSTSETYNDVDEVNASMRRMSAREQKSNLKAKLKLSNKF